MSYERTSPRHSLGFLAVGIYVVRYINTPPRPNQGITFVLRSSLFVLPFVPFYRHNILRGFQLTLGSCLLVDGESMILVEPLQLR